MLRRRQLPKLALPHQPLQALRGGAAVAQHPPAARALEPRSHALCALGAVRNAAMRRKCSGAAMLWHRHMGLHNVAQRMAPGAPSAPIRADRVLAQDLRRWHARARECGERTLPLMKMRICMSAWRETERMLEPVSDSSWLRVRRAAYGDRCLRCAQTAAGSDCESDAARVPALMRGEAEQAPCELLLDEIAKGTCEAASR
eukprot:6204011-Pleurochrysis_carterae.AAC.1